MSDTPKLLPCPFCGDCMSVTASGMAVHIDPGDCILGSMGIPADHDKSLTQWNTRTAPKVKPLVWDGDFAHTNLGGYYHIENGNEHALILKFHTGSSEMGISVRYTIPAIEEDAQAHYESRILSTLER